MILINRKSRFPSRCTAVRCRPPAISLQPAEVTQTITAGEEFRATVAIHTYELAGQPWLLGLDCDRKDIITSQPVAVRTAKSSTGFTAREYAIEVHAPATIDFSGRLITQLKPRTASASVRPIKPIRLVIEKREVMTAYPSQLFISCKNVECWPVQRTVVIVGAPGETWDIEDVSSTSDWLSTEQLEPDPDSPLTRTLKVSVQKPPDDLDPADEQFLSVKTSSARQPLLQIAVVVAQ